MIKEKIERLDAQDKGRPEYHHHDKEMGDRLKALNIDEVNGILKDYEDDVDCRIYYDNWMETENRYFGQTKDLHKFFYYDTEN